MANMVAGKDNDNGVVEFQFEKRVKLSKWETFKKALYDPNTNQILGRTPKSWGQLLLFYSIFYAVLAALFAICMEGLFASLDDKKPTWTLDSSLIGTNPGLGFRPISSRTEEGSLIWYNITNQTTSEKWTTLIDEFLEPYKKDQTGQNFVSCNFSKPPGEGQVCVTTVEQLGNCNPANSYGYKSASPCIFLKLNRIFDWQPDFYTQPIPEMPEDLVDHINNTQSDDEKKQIWLSCNGVSDFDKENTQDGFAYFPRGFPYYYYPYKNNKNYLSPVIGVQILNPTPNVIINIECRAWAKNILYKGGSLNRAGSVEFQIQVDTAPPFVSAANKTIELQ